MILVKLMTKTLMRMMLNKKAMRQKKTTTMKKKSLKVIKLWLVKMTTNGKTCLTLSKLRKYRMTLFRKIVFLFTLIHFHGFLKFSHKLMCNCHENYLT